MHPAILKRRYKADTAMAEKLQWHIYVCTKAEHDTVGVADMNAWYK